MKLSFVIPAHNEENYVAKCLDSITRELRGTSYDTEIIVVNNASTDRTREVAGRFHNVKIVDEPEKGLVRARRAGFLAATGDLIANVDADTMLTPGWIKKVFEEFSKNPKLVALSGPFVYYDLPWAANILVKGIFYPIAFATYLVSRVIFRRGTMLQGGNFVVRREALESIGGYNTDIDFYGEDTDIARRVSKVGQVKFTFGLPIYASGRRLAGEGIFTMGIRYGGNYLWTIIFKKPFSQTSTDVRPKSKEDVLEYRPENKFKETIIASATIIVLLGLLAGIGYAGYVIILKVVSTINK